MLESLTTVGQLALVVIGFGAVIFIHELGHFLAAKWAGIRVHEFAIGFGKPILAWRRGVGLRAGSTRVSPDPRIDDGVGETEYRLNWLPFGGYVKMLGQDDLNPSESSDPDSYTQKPVWKRMVVVSAGVVMNLILAAVLFVIVFMAGMPAPSATIGMVRDDSAAQRAVPVSHDALDRGLRPGDRVLRIGGRRAMSFADLSLAAAMAQRGAEIPIIIERDGYAEPIEFALIPTFSDESQLMEFGVTPATSAELEPAPAEPDQRFLYDMLRERAGLTDVPDGSRLVSVEGRPVQLGTALTEALATSDGAPVSFTIETPDGSIDERTIAPEPALQEATTVGADKRRFQHLLGLRPAAVVGACSEHATEQGLRRGDVLARVGDTIWPNIEQTTEAIRAGAGRSIPIRVLRNGAYTDLTVEVQRTGLVGMYFESSPSALPAIVARAPKAEEPLAANPIDLAPGTRMLRIGGEPVETFADLRAALRTIDAGETDVLVRLPIGADPAAAPTDTVAWGLARTDLERVADLGWTSPVEPALFRIRETTLKASGPLDALRMGVSETHRYVMMTYLTFVRLVQGTVKVEHIKGPVGIAHFGTKVVEQGFLRLIFFLAVISANLAVINFLPLPIVDGGLFVFLLVEAITRKPVSVAIQSAATLVGIVLIGAVFLLVTFNDIRTLFGS